MSTTIYNAVRFNPGINLSEVVKLCMGLRPVVQQKLYQKDIQELLATAVRIYDHKVLEKLSWTSDRGTKDSKCAFMSAFRQLDEDNREHKKNYGEKTDRIVLFPHGRSIYAIVYVADAEELINKFTEEGIWTDFSYWNNTDRPDEVTSSQWSRRKKVWDEIFADSSMPADVGVNINLSKADQKIFNYQEFFGQLRTAIQNQQPFTHAGKWPSPHRRVVAMSHMVENAPWMAEYFASNQSLGVFSRISREIEQGENDAFNQARPFLEQHVLDQLTWETLWTSFEDLAPHFESKRQSVLSQDIPVALQTPLFQNARLNHSLNTTAPTAPKSKI